jgi:hypothetical protein
MVKTNIFTRPDANLEMPLENRMFRSARTDNGYNGSRTARGKRLRNSIDELESIWKNLPLFHTICASGIVDRMSGEVFFQSPAVGFLGFHCGST